MIKNLDLVKSLEILLNKKYNKILNDDLKMIKSISFSKFDNNSNQINNILELRILPNLQVLNIHDCIITQKDIEFLTNFKDLYSLNFSRCIISESVNFCNLKNLLALNIDRCFISKYEILQTAKSLKRLIILFPTINENIDASNISNLVDLEQLFIKGCDISKSQELKKLQNLKILNLLLSNLDDLNFIYDMKNLEKMYLSENYVDKITLKLISAEIFTNEIDLVIDDKNNSKNLI